MVSSPSVSPSRTRPPTATDPTGELTPTTTTTTSTSASASVTATWTPEQEARLLYCQDQLKQAQKKWSDRQELWIREVDHLLDLKRAFLKKTRSKESSLPRLWRTKTKRPTTSTTTTTMRRSSWRPLSRTQSEKVDSGVWNEREEVEDVEDREEEEEEDDPLARARAMKGRSKSTGTGTRTGYSPSLSRTLTTTPTPTPTSSSSPPPPPRNPFNLKRMIRRLSGAKAVSQQSPSPAAEERRRRASDSPPCRGGNG